MNLFLIGFVIIGLIIFFQKKKAIASSASLDQLLDNKRAEIITVSTSSVPGKNIKSVIGAVSGKSKTKASSEHEFDLAEKEAMLAVIENAQRLGANAIIDLKATTGTYQAQGSQWQVSQTMYSGTAVIIE